MPQHKQAKKRVRQNEKHRLHNKPQSTRIKTSVKKVMEEDDKEKAQEKLQQAFSYLDKMTGKGRIHRNNAARKKSRMTKHVNNL